MVSVVLRDEAEVLLARVSAHLEVYLVFALRQGRQCNPQPIGDRLVLIRLHSEDVVLREGHLEEIRLRTNYPIANILTVDRNLYAQVGVFYHRLYEVLDIIARYLEL